MANTTYAAAYTALFTALCSNTTTGSPHASMTAVKRVYQYEPKPGQMLKPVSLAITPAGWNETEYLFEVRLYSAFEENAETGASNLVSAMDQTDARIKTTQMGPSKWATGWLANEMVMVARSEVRAPREDGF